MKILAISDSHGNTDALLRAAAVTGPELILHMGDHSWDCDVLRQNMPQIPVRAGRGNCDRQASELDIDEFVVEGKRIFMTHGNLYGVKMGLDQLITTAMYRNADVVLFGHTHIPYSEEFEGMLILNPGSVGRGEKTYAVITIENGVVKYEIKHLDMWN